MPDPGTAVTGGMSLLGLNEARKGRKGAQAGYDSAAEATMYAADKEYELGLKSLEQQQKAFDFEQKKYDKWLKTYGDMEENLAKMYKKLTPGAYAARGIEGFEKEFETRMENIRTNLAQRGISLDSGLAIDLEKEAELDAAETRAGIRVAAEDYVRDKQTDFLQVGLGQEPSMSRAHQNLASGYDTVRQAAGTGTAVARTNLNTATSNLNTAMASESKALGTVINEAGTALADYLDKPKSSPQAELYRSPN